MTYQLFKSYIREHMCNAFPEGTSVNIQSIQKNNDVFLDGLTIMESDCNVAPTIYLNDFYSDYCNGTTLEEIINHILNLYQSAKPDAPIDLSFFTDFEQVKNRIMFKLIHYEKNQVLLQDIPHFPYLDLAIVFYCLVESHSTGNATILIRNNHLALWDISADELYQHARRNTPRTLPPLCQPLTGMLMEMMCDDTENAALSELQDAENIPPLFVLTNEKKSFGACALLYPDSLKQAATQLERDLYILPSSIHEVLLLPVDTQMSPDELSEMVREINRTQLEKEEVLSDHIYYYSLDRDTLRMV
ncbi:MAG: DUF5688 family protein [Roseburia sp.]